MASILNLLTLALEEMLDNGQTNITLTDQNLEFLRNMRSGTEVEKNDKLEPNCCEILQQNTYPRNELKVIPGNDKTFKYNWLRETVLACPVCQRHVKPGRKIVFGVGNLDAKIFFCGEAPGAEEEIVGEPFVGRAGQLLTKIISAMGLERSDVYIGNIMNWRPEMDSATGNRPPTREEMEFCLPYLEAQIDIVQPRVIVALGSTAVSGLLGHDPARRMRDIRGKWTEFRGIPLIVTFHPSYLLRNGTNFSKRTVWEDMLAVMEKIDLPISDKQRGFFL